MTPRSAADPSSEKPRLRADARANRERVLTAARAAMAEHGADVSIEEIARRAGVGVGTVYRRFPTKDVLVEAIVDEQLTHIEALGDSALAVADPWAAIESFFSKLLELHRHDGRIKALVSSRLAAGERTTSIPQQIGELCHRAQAAGVLRIDAGPADVLALLWASSRLASTTEETFPDYPRRFIALALDALRPGSGPLPGVPPDAEALARAMRSGSSRSRPD